MITLPCLSELLKPLENAIRHKLIPALTEGRCYSGDEKALLSLPVRLGGLGIIHPTKISDEEFEKDDTRVNIQKVSTNCPE